MADDEGAPVDLEEVVERLRRQVDERRARGEYPEGLVESLDEQFRQLTAQRELPAWPAAEEAAATARLAEAGRFGRDRIPLGGGSAARRAVHEVASMLVVRQVQGVLEQTQAFADATRAALAAHWQALVALDARQAGLEQRLESALDRVARYERGDGPPGATAVELRHELRSVRRERRATSCFDGLATEAVDGLLGTRDDVGRALGPLVDRVTSGPVVDLGLGRGEAAELLAGRGLDVTAVGVEPDLVARSGAGAGVRHGDVVDALAELDDATCGGVVVTQVVERLGVADLGDLVAEAARVLRPGGVLVVAAGHPGPGGAPADPLALRPVATAYLAGLARAAGFTEVAVETPGAGGPPALVARR